MRALAITAIMQPECASLLALRQLMPGTDHEYALISARLLCWIQDTLVTTLQLPPENVSSLARLTAITEI